MVEGLLMLWFVIGFVSMNYILKTKQEVVSDKTPAYYILGMIGGLVTTGIYWFKYRK